MVPEIGKSAEIQHKTARQRRTECEKGFGRITASLI